MLMPLTHTTESYNESIVQSDAMRPELTFDPNPQASEAVKLPADCTLPCCVKQVPIVKLGFKCAAEGYEINCGGTPCKAHIITRKVKPTKKNRVNILIVCKRHEEHFNKKHVREWYAWVKMHYPVNFKAVHTQAKYVYEQLKAYMEIVDRQGL